MTLETIVRPFETPTYAPAGRSIPVASPTAPDPDDDGFIHVKIGVDGGTLKTLEGSANATLTRYMDQKQRQRATSTEVVRIKNKDDESQYVDVERVIEDSTKVGAGSKYQKTKSEYKPYGDAGEVIERKTYGE